MLDTGFESAADFTCFHHDDGVVRPQHPDRNVQVLAQVADVHVRECNLLVDLERTHLLVEIHLDCDDVAFADAHVLVRHNVT